MSLPAGSIPGRMLLKSKSATQAAAFPRKACLTFLSFFATKTEGKGLGLGLSTVFGIVDRHKGSIEVRSEIGQGAAFIIRVPVGPKGPV